VKALPPEGDQYGLQGDDGENDDDEELVPLDPREDVAFLVYLAASEEVEQLHHHKGIEDESEMAGVDASLVKNGLIVVAATNGNEPPTADRALDFTVVPLPVRVGCEGGRIVGIAILWDEFFACEDEDDHDYELEDGLAHDVLHHRIRNDALMPAIWLAL
jgi:hypothetical protein